MATTFAVLRRPAGLVLLLAVVVECHSPLTGGGKNARLRAARAACEGTDDYFDCKGVLLKGSACDDGCARAKGALASMLKTCWDEEATDLISCSTEGLLMSGGGGKDCSVAVSGANELLSQEAAEPREANYTTCTERIDQGGDLGFITVGSKVGTCSQLASALNRAVDKFVETGLCPLDYPTSTTTRTATTTTATLTSTSATTVTGTSTTGTSITVTATTSSATLTTGTTTTTATTATSVTKTTTTLECNPHSYLACPTLGRRFLQPGCSSPKCTGLESLKTMLGELMECDDPDPPSVTHVGACSSGGAMISAASASDCQTIVTSLNDLASASIYQKDGVVHEPLTCRSYGLYTLIATNTADGFDCPSVVTMFNSLIAAHQTDSECPGVTTTATSTATSTATTTTTDTSTTATNTSSTSTETSTTQTVTNTTTTWTTTTTATDTTTTTMTATTKTSTTETSTMTSSTTVTSATESSTTETTTWTTATASSTTSSSTGTTTTDSCCDRYLKDWVDVDGTSCEEYADISNACQLYGHGYAGLGGLTANQACCTCGGGALWPSNLCNSFTTTATTVTATNTSTSATDTTTTITATTATATSVTTTATATTTSSSRTDTSATGTSTTTTVSTQTASSVTSSTTLTTATETTSTITSTSATVVSATSTTTLTKEQLACDSEPCQNGGQCVNVDSSGGTEGEASGGAAAQNATVAARGYYCMCDGNFVGEQCEIEPTTTSVTSTFTVSTVTGTSKTATVTTATTATTHTLTTTTSATSTTKTTTTHDPYCSGAVGQCFAFERQSNCTAAGCFWGTTTVTTSITTSTTTSGTTTTACTDSERYDMPMAEGCCYAYYKTGGASPTLRGDSTGCTKNGGNCPCDGGASQYSLATTVAYGLSCSAISQCQSGFPVEYDESTSSAGTTAAPPTGEEEPSTATITTVEAQTTQAQASCAELAADDCPPSRCTLRTHSIEIDGNAVVFTSCSAFESLETEALTTPSPGPTTASTKPPTTAVGATTTTVGATTTVSAVTTPPSDSPTYPRITDVPTGGTVADPGEGQSGSGDDLGSGVAPLTVTTTAATEAPTTPVLVKKSVAPAEAGAINLGPRCRDADRAGANGQRGADILFGGALVEDLPFNPKVESCTDLRLFCKDTTFIPGWSEEATSRLVGCVRNLCPGSCGLCPEPSERGASPPANWEVDGDGWAINSLAWVVSARCDASPWPTTPAAEMDTSVVEVAETTTTPASEPTATTEGEEREEFADISGGSADTASVSSDVHILIVFAGVGVVLASAMYLYVRANHRSGSTDLSTSGSAAVSYAAGPYPQLSPHFPVAMEQTTL